MLGSSVLDRLLLPCQGELFYRVPRWRGKGVPLLTDKQGNPLGIGDVVDIHINDVMTAVVTEITEGGLVDGEGHISLAMLKVTVPIPIRLNPGQPAPVYLLKKAEPKPKARIM